MAQQTNSELVQKLMTLFEEKGKSLNWPKKEARAILKKWHEELTGEAKRLGEVLSSRSNLDLAEATTVFGEFASSQKNRQQETDKWQRELSGLSKKRLAIKNEVEKIIGQPEALPEKIEKKTNRTDKPGLLKTIKSRSSTITV